MFYGAGGEIVTVFYHFSKPVQLAVKLKFVPAGKIKTIGLTGGFYFPGFEAERPAFIRIRGENLSLLTMTSATVE